MFDDTGNEPPMGLHKPARDWIRTLSKYRTPSTKRSLSEVALTVVPLFALWSLSLMALNLSALAAVPIAMIAGIFLVRLFVIQHDCGHGAFLSNRRAQDWIGRLCGVLTCTPYADWKHTHSVHHAHAGHLDKRGMGDVKTMTLDEYQRAGAMERFKYRIYRHPLFLFGIAPMVLFVCQYRLPYSLTAHKKFWISTMGTKIGILFLLTLFYVLGGWSSIAFVWLPSIAVGSMIGVWLFYVQHQFEDTSWDHEADWDMHEAALHGSSHYVMPPVMQWLSGNIGIHHVHHLFSRIPFYRLPEVLRDHPELDDPSIRLTIRESLTCTRHHLWDAQSRKLLTFRQARAL
jgi:omega-6 fatty acid desaturase (delta-12 desaturase)